MRIIKSLVGAGMGALFALSGGFAHAQSLERMAGQMIVSGFSGNDLSDRGVIAVREDLSAGRLGGVMFLKVNVSSAANVIAMTNAFWSAAGDIPPFITIDQEGGLVERLTRDVGFAEVPSPENVAQQMNVNHAQALYGGMAQGLAEWGFNVNFGPVVDLDVNPANPVIGRFGRAFSSDPEIVADYAEAFISAHNAAGMLTALKHFPGHGSSAADSHEGFVDISKSWSAAELEPFQHLIAANRVDMVMTGHLFADVGLGGDSQQVPASLSAQWIDGQLRGQLGFNGVVVSDDMEMGAIRGIYSFEDAIIAAVNAGVDILLFSNTANNRTSLAAEVQAVLVAEAERDPAFRARIEQSYERIIALKSRL